jgi:hypothetical protein
MPEHQRGGIVLDSAPDWSPAPAVTHFVCRALAPVALWGGGEERPMPPPPTHLGSR